jgi:uncharacterized protein
VAARASSATAAFAVLLLWPPVSFAAAAHPSFPCISALNPTEAAICTDETLAALDRAVATAYRNKFDGLPVESAGALDQVVRSLVITQKAWLAYRDSCRGDHGCIFEAYRARKAALTSGGETKDIPCGDIVGVEQAAVYVGDCIAVATETHPPCNADNACELIVSHNIFRCIGLGDGAPKFCAAYIKP